MDTMRRRFEELYAAFNRRDLDALLAAMAPDVDWPNGMEGGRVLGHAAVRDYWTRQWGMIDPRVEVVSCAEEEDGRIAVGVHQTVRDLEGNPLVDQRVEHVYAMRDGRVESMEIR